MVLSPTRAHILCVMSDVFRADARSPRRYVTPLLIPLTSALLLLASSLAVDPAFSQISWTRHPANPVLPPGTNSAWDSYWMGVCSVIREDSQYTMWYSGSPDGNRPRVGRATSTDGIVWQKDVLNPVVGVGAPTAWDADGAFLPKVLLDNAVYTMWYGSGKEIGRATSSDGRFWQKDRLNPLLSFGQPGAWDESFVDPANVLFDGSTYRMWFDGASGGDFPGTSMGIGYATSKDGVHWTKDLQNPVLSAGPPGSWDYGGIGGCTVLYDEGHYHLWYTGNFVNFDTDRMSGIGYAVSSDGKNWKKYPGNPVLRNDPSYPWEFGQVYFPAALRVGSTFRLWYSGRGDAIGLATSPRASATIVLEQSRIRAGSLIRDTIAPTPIDYGNVRPGVLSDTVSITISNWGFTPLVISSISRSRSEFLLSNLPVFPATIPPFAEIRIGVRFGPVQAGVVTTDSILVASSDSLRPLSTIPIRGRGAGTILPAHGATLYATKFSDVYSIDRSDAGARLIASLSPDPPPQMQSLCVRRTDNTLYGAQSTPARTMLYRISAENGDLDTAGQIPIGDVVAITFGPEDSLYSADTHGKVFVMKGTTGFPRLLGTPGVQVSGLAFSPVTGELWGSAGDTVYTIDTRIGAATMVGSGYPGTGHSSVAFSPLGTLYGLYDDALVRIDPITGKATLLGPTGVAGLRCIAMRTDNESVDVQSEADVPRVTQIQQNYPNPFNGTSNVGFRMADDGSVKLAVYDILGREVAVLINERRSAGEYTVRFDAAGLVSGVYLVRLSAGSVVQTRKMILIR
jgi:beta-1,2-mannobiose phosphorylase / 1,2-beta-oligomannan phosphorylase